MTLQLARSIEDIALASRNMKETADTLMRDANGGSKATGSKATAQPVLSFA